MITIAKLRRKLRYFCADTGPTVVEFNALFAQVAPADEAAELAKRHRPQRLDAVGSGRPFRLALPERVLLGLMYLRLDVRQSLLRCPFKLPL